MPSMASSTSPPPPPPPPDQPSSSSAPAPSASFHGCCGTRARALLVVVPLTLISFVVLAADTKSSTFLWFSPHNPFSPSVNGGGGGDGGSGGANGGIVVEVRRGGSTPPDASVAPSNASLPPAMSSAPPPTMMPAQPPQAQPEPSDAELSRLNAAPKTGSRDVKLERLELGLAKARAAIREAARNSSGELADKDYVPKGPIYRNARAFHRSYLEMEKLFKVNVYREGEPPLFHDGPCRSIYSSEGRFINSLDMDSHFRTADPDLAHVHFLPFSIVKMVKTIYIRETRDSSPMMRTIADYVNLIAQRYPYWNRSLGADHFMLSCHDWGPFLSKAVPELFSNSIRVLCNANSSEGFNPAKDASLPEINIKDDDLAGMVGGPSPSKRPILAFFAGGNHGPVRPLVLEAWKGKDEEMQVHEYLPKGVNYYDYMRRSKFCLCPSGYEVASPRIVEAIYLGCVPVTINSHYVLPFSDVLDWKAFSVDVPLEEIPNLKRILSGISQRQYIRMQRRVEQVRRHFMVHGAPQRYDMFHMLLHSVWLRRLNVRIYPRD